jgi:HlyD family secretion protein
MTSSGRLTAGAALVIGASLARPFLALPFLALPFLALPWDGNVFAADTNPAPGAQVIVVRASNACFSAMIRATGYLVPREEAMVLLVDPGLKVVEVLVGEGDRVTSGQTLARLASLPGQAPEPAPPGRNTTTLRAPAAGVITRSTASVGAVASTVRSEPLFRIAVGNEIELEVEISSTHIPELGPGQTARVEIEDGRELSGRVRLAPAEVDQRTQLGRARVSLEADSSLRIGRFARATIDANRSCGISVPRSAVLYRTEGTSVQVVRDATIETRLVQVGLHSDTDTEIRDGLREGDVVVANAGTSLRAGDKVTAIFADGTQMGQR